MIPTTETSSDPFGDVERLALVSDPETGLRAVVAVHGTTLGPALGGTRMRTYAEYSTPISAACQDAVALARAMSLKNALAGLPHGGGKGVLIGDPGLKSRDVLRAYGRMVASLDGEYVTAGDVGINSEDLDVIAEECRWTTGRSTQMGGLGDSGILTAVGVWRGMKAGAEHLWGRGDLAARRVGVLGAGKVGARLVQHLVEEDADVIVYDPDPVVLDRLRTTWPNVKIAQSEGEVLAENLDILSPNGLGGLITKELATSVNARLICGGANNQIADSLAPEILESTDKLYLPDFLVNSGGVIQVAAEFAGSDFSQAYEDTLGIFETTSRVLDRARREAITPLTAARLQAEEIIRRKEHG